jgi:hypothetical protein
MSPFALCNQKRFESRVDTTRTDIVHYCIDQRGQKAMSRFAAAAAVLLVSAFPAFADPGDGWGGGDGHHHHHHGAPVPLLAAGAPSFLALAGASAGALLARRRRAAEKREG